MRKTTLFDCNFDRHSRECIEEERKFQFFCRRLAFGYRDTS